MVVDLDVGHLVAQHFSLEGALPAWSRSRSALVVQEEPLGLGHAVKEAADVVGDRPFFCLLADNIVRPGGDVLESLAGGEQRGIDVGDVPS